MKRLGSSDIDVSVLGVGCLGFGTRVDQETVASIVDAALESGVTFFDTADTYGLGSSEQALGRALAGRRERVVVATKFGMTMQGANGDERARASRRYMLPAVQSSLRRLGTDYIDLYQLHVPDRVTPIAETLDAMSELVDMGFVRAIGCSNLTAGEVESASRTAQSLGLARFVSAQNEYSLYNRAAETELAPICEQLVMGLLPYHPLAHGLLTGKYTRDTPAPSGSRLEPQPDHLARTDWDVIGRLQAFADARNVPLLNVAIGGLAAQPAVASVIAEVSSAAQVVRNAEAARWRPTGVDLAELTRIPGVVNGSYTTYAPAARRQRSSLCQSLA